MLHLLRNLIARLPITVSSHLPVNIPTLENSLRPSAESITSLYDLLFQYDKHIAQPAAHTLDVLFDKCTAVDLLRIDARMRERLRYTLHQVDPSQVHNLSLAKAGPLGLFSFNHNGRVREAALRELLLVHTGAELPFLLMRLTDWVPVIQQLAERAVRDRLTEPNIPHFAKNLGLLHLLSRRARLQRGITDAIETLLQSEPDRSALFAQLASHDAHTRRRATELLFAKPELLSPELIARFLASPNPAVRATAVAALRKCLTGQPLFDFLSHAVNDKAISVRQHALYGFAEQLPNRAPPFLEAALLDRSPTLREIARFYLRRAGHSDFAPLYRAQLLPNNPRLRIAIAGLGETGTPADAPLIAPFLTHPTPATRRAALRAFAKFAPDQSAQAITTALRDPALSLAKTARDLLQSRPEPLTPQLLADLLAENPTGPRALVALSLTPFLPRWEDLPLLIPATTSSDPTVADFARTRLLAWRANPNRLVHPPTSAQRALLRAAVHQPHNLTPDLLQELRAALNA